MPFTTFYSMIHNLCITIKQNFVLPYCSSIFSRGRM